MKLLKLVFFSLLIFGGNIFAQINLDHRLVAYYSFNKNANDESGNGNHGTVLGASIISSTLNSPRMEECILNRIKRWRNFSPCDPAVGDKTYRQSFSFGEAK